LFQRCRARIKGNRDKIVSNLRNIHPHNDVEELILTSGKFESDVTCHMWSAGYETEESALTAEGTMLQVIYMF
jgi:hypothetical protein